MDLKASLDSFRILSSAGLIRPISPRKLLRMRMVLRRWGVRQATGYALSAINYPDEPALVDELGQVTFAEVESRTNAIARGLSQYGIVGGDTVAVLCRNHRYLPYSAVALGKLGTTIVWLNTSFAGPQLADVCEREGVRAVIHDQEFGEVLREAGPGRKCFVAWEEGSADGQTLEGLIATHDSGPLEAPQQSGRTIILTSGTTGRPQGAARTNLNPSGLRPAISLFSRIPLHVRDRMVISAPLFHSHGFVHFWLGLLLSTTAVLQRRFDPEATLAAIERERARVLVAVPVMLQRILELPEATRRTYDTSSLKVAVVSGSALAGGLATRFMDEFGDVLYNLYGSTEVGAASIATPRDLRAAPDTAGKAPLRTVLRIYDLNDRPVPPGTTGRIFVGSDSLFEGYTGGGGKPSIDGLAATGDLGHLDSEGRLFVEGRDDEMVVSGGENVYPNEVEELLARHAGVADVAVIGVPDEQFGQRLKAFVVKRPGAELTEEDVKDYVRSNLARYKVPRSVDFLSELPRNATGKVVKRELSRA